MALMDVGDAAKRNLADHHRPFIVPAHSYSRFLRSIGRIPLPWMVLALLPFLHHVATTLPASLLPGTLLCCKSMSMMSILARSYRITELVLSIAFQILLFAAIFDLATTTLKPRVRLQLVGVIALVTIYTYYHFSPLVYAGQWTKSECERSKWVKGWDFSW